MALNHLPFRINGSDKLRTGFRAKYNLELNKAIKDWRVETDVTKTDYGFLYLITQDDTLVPLDLSGAYYTKDAIDELYGIRYATEEEAGIIRIATEEEALEGSDDLTVITPYKLWLVLSYLLGRTIVAAEPLTAGQLIYLFIPEEDELIEPPVEPEDPEEPADPEPFPGIPEEPEGDLEPEDPEDTEDPTDSLFPVLYAKLAVATAMETACMGWVEYDALAGEETFIKLSGTINTYQENMTPGTYLYLSADDPGLLTNIPSSEPGNIVQIVGYAISEIEVMMEIHRPDLNWDPVFIDFPELYFVVKKTSTQEVDLMDYFAPYNFLYTEEIDAFGDTILVPYVNFSYKFLDLPIWISEHTVVFDNMSLTGTPPIVGRFVAYLQVINIYGRTFNQPLILNVIPAPKITSVLLDTTVPEILGKIPGAYFLPEKFDTKTTIDGPHDKYNLKITGGGPSGNAISHEVEQQVLQTDLASYRTFLEDDGIEGVVGLYKLVISTFVNAILNSLTTIWFTLYDEEYIGKWKAELWDVVADAKIGDISIQDVTIFKQPANSWDVKSIVTGLEHDKVTIKFYFEEDLIQTTVYEQNPTVEDIEYYIYDTPQVDQLPGNYVVEESFELLGEEIYQRRSAFSILKKNPVAESGVELVTYTAGTVNYDIITTLPMKGLSIDLPTKGFGFLVEMFSEMVDFVGIEFFSKISNAFVAFNLTPYTKKQPYISFPEPVFRVDALAFRDLSSLEISDIHKAPSSYRVRYTGRFGGENGEIIEVKQADVDFRIPLAPEDYSGLRFINVTSGGSSDPEVIDLNMPKSGATYTIPVFPVLWSVSFRTLGSVMFDRVELYMTKDGVALHNFAYGSAIIKHYTSATTSLNRDTAAQIIGTLVGDHRTALNPSNVPVNIDVPGLYKVTALVYLLGVLVGTLESEFTLGAPVEEEEVEETDCCGLGEMMRFDFVNLTEWVVNHNLDKYPDINIVIDGQQWQGDIIHLNSNTLKVVFKRPRTGFIEIN